MIALWMTYALLFSLLLSLAAWGAEQALRLHRRSARWTWAAALGASVAVPALSLWRPPVTDVTAPDPIASSPVAVSTLRSLGELGVFSDAAVWWSGVVLVVLWPLLSVAALTVFALGLLRVRRDRARWQHAVVAGRWVRVSDAFGPAVVGVLSPEIVLPRWMLTLDDESLRLVLRHEREHQSARDTLLLCSGFIAASAIPWNPFAWLAFRRLRLALEIDCDQRVLRDGTDRRRYGNLLIRVGEREANAALAAAALTEPTSFLERRIYMMTQPSPRRRWVRTLSAATVAAGAVLAACDIPTPTLPAAPVPSRAAVEGLVTRLTAQDTAADDWTDDTARNQPVIFVDGVKLTDSVPYQLERLDNSDIVRVEIVKGPAAKHLYPNDPQAANGVIHLFMKPQRIGERRGETPR